MKFFAAIAAMAVIANGVNTEQKKPSTFVVDSTPNNAFNKYKGAFAKKYVKHTGPKSLGNCKVGIQAAKLFDSTKKYDEGYVRIMVDGKEAMRTDTEKFFNDNINFRDFATTVPVKSWSSKVSIELWSAKEHKLMRIGDTMDKFCSKDGGKQIYDLNEGGNDEHEMYFDIRNEFLPAKSAAQREAPASPLGQCKLGIEAAIVTEGKDKDAHMRIKVDGHQVLKTESMKLNGLGMGRFDANDTIVPITNWDSNVEIALFAKDGKPLLKTTTKMSKFCPEDVDNQMFDTSEGGADNATKVNAKKVFAFVNEFLPIEQ